MVKYSIIVPVKNSLQYLPECIKSITQQNYSNYELIVSDDNSNDGTKEYLATINHPNIKILHTERCLNIIEHFDFAIRNSCGEWLMTLGGDDGLQSYFFYLADKLTDIASKKNIRTIASKRAYYVWDGCQNIHGDLAVDYFADFNRKYIIERSLTEMFKVLMECKEDNYHSLPTMYTTSIFHYSLIKEAREKCGSLFFFSFPDVNFAALSTSIEKFYIYSTIPLGWVGGSPKSNNRDEKLKIQLHSIPYNCGNYDLLSYSIFYWGALISFEKLFSSRKLRYLSSRIFMTIMFGQILNSIFCTRNKNMIKRRKLRLKYLYEIVRINKCNKYFVICISIFSFIPHLIIKAMRKIIKKIISVSLLKKKYIKEYITRSSNPALTINEANKIIKELVGGFIYE